VQDIVVPSAAGVTPQSFDLPREDDLRSLLSIHRFAPGVEPHRHAPQSLPYFLDGEHAARDPRGAGPAVPAAHPPFDVNAIRRDFPILQERVHGKQLVWFDNAATTHKPQAVIDRLAYFYAHENSNIHRAAHALAGRATDAYEIARAIAQRFIGAALPEEIVFVRGTTEAINLIAKTWGSCNVGEGDEIVELAHRAGAKALVDGAQSVSHMRVDVQALDADFFVFSGHKIFGPTGIGVAYGKRTILEDMPPWQGGGNMIADVTFERTVFQPPPNRFEAGTGNIADAVGLGAALEYVERIGIENIERYEHDLLEYATSRLGPVPGVRLVGTARHKASVLSFVLQGYETEEVGRALNEEGITVRSGHHCAQPILRRFGLEATVRPSLAFYNTCDEVDAMVSVIRHLSARSARG
jgi:selenocysteine lyase/cysteine desulfurase